MAVPYTFASATTSIPLSELDANFATTITLGNTAIELGNTVTTLNNMTLANVTISSGSVTITDVTASGNVTLSGGTANGVVYLNGSKVATSGTALVFDGTNLGIGTSSPSVKLDVSGKIRGYLNNTSVGNASSAQFVQDGTGDAAISFLIGATTEWLAGVDNSDSDSFKISNITGGGDFTSTGLTLTTSGNLGIGTSSPSSTLQLKASSGNTGLYIQDASGSPNLSFLDSAGTVQWQLYSTMGGAAGLDPLILYNSSVGSVATFSTSGNLGLGVTPSAWSGAVPTALQVGPTASFAANSDGTTQFTQNAYYNGSAWKYIASGYSQRIALSPIDGSISFNNAASGTAAGTVTFTQAMTLDASGNLGIGATSPSGKLHIQRASAGNLIYANDGVSAGLTVSTSGFGCFLDTQSSAGFFAFTKNSGATEFARIDSSGNLLVGTTAAYTTAANSQIASKSTSPVGYSQFVLGNSTQGYLYVNIADTYTWNNTDSIMYIGSRGYTGRSINASGTVNASGADYAEYMTKAGDFTIVKGDVCGIDANGNLTNVFANAVSFVVKSTNPSYVGGDSWGSVDIFGNKPEDEKELTAWQAKLEDARQKVDRIAFSGQVPVNVTGATPGQYIIPVNDNGAIKGQAVSNPTFEQYQIAVGKVIAIEADGRARIIVKVA